MILDSLRNVLKYWKRVKMPFSLNLMVFSSLAKFNFPGNPFQSIQPEPFVKAQSHHYLCNSSADCFTRWKTIVHHWWIQVYHRSLSDVLTLPMFPKWSFANRCLLFALPFLCPSQAWYCELILSVSSTLHSGFSKRSFMSPCWSMCSGASGIG